ncbi:MAG TPA: hypothetical protein DDZ89_00670 [Clostridiales bacterium]|nr:hypothetical protein [Clostridiales bacterium]
MLHDELTVEQMKQGLSKPRNRGIANAFVYMGIVETWGSGIPKIYAESTAYRLREPELIPSDLILELTYTAMNPSLMALMALAWTVT